MIRFRLRLRRFSAFLSACASLFLQCNSQSVSAVEVDPVFKDAPKPPNILFFFVDDMGWQDTSVPFWKESTPFNSHFQTPAMETLAAQGRKFTQAYACAVCSPSRTSWMTGMNAARHQVTNWTLFADQETSGQTPRLKAPTDWDRSGLQPHPDLLPQMLKDQLGYRTIHAGKAHWGAFDTAGSEPTTLGFDVNIAGHSAGGPGHYHGENNYGNEEVGGYTRPWGIPGLEEYHGTSKHLTDALTEKSMKAVERAVQDGKPFFLYMAHYAVHAPIRPHKRFLSDYLGKKYPGTDIEIPQAEAYYASMVEGMDDSLQQLMEKFEELGVAENTLVIFASDNGGLSKHARGVTPRGTGQDTHCWPLREGKGSAYEGGTRVPFIVSWSKPCASSSLQKKLPIEAGSVSSAPIIIEDVYSTLSNWLGLKPDSRTDCEIDGLDWTSELLSSEEKSTEKFVQRPLVFHYPHQWTGSPVGGYQPHSSIRLGAWKAIYFYESQSWELYQLEDDIDESENLADQRPEILKTLAKRLLKELDSRGALWPVEKNSNAPERMKLPK